MSVLSLNFTVICALIVVGLRAIHLSFLSVSFSFLDAH